MTAAAQVARPGPDMLAGLVEAAERQTARRRAERTEDALSVVAAGAPTPRDLAGALRRAGGGDPGAGRPGWGVIAETKRRSPSKGRLCDGEYDPGERAARYAAGGAAALSVLTHEDGFGGHPCDLARVRAATALPLLRKDFVTETYQITEARAMGADAVLLIVAALEPSTLDALLAHTRALGMQALVEVHDEAETDVALEVGAEIIGVNHRNLRTFRIDPTLTARLRPRVGPDRLLIAESGVRGAADARALRAAGADGLLVGELVMRSARPDETIEELRNVPDDIPDDHDDTDRPDDRGRAG